MPTYPFAEVLNTGKTLISGLKNNPQTVIKRGIDAEFTANMEKKLALVRQLDNEQESLKAKLKTKTAELNAEFKEFRAMISEAKKVVKLSVNQSGWREYGIEDKK